MNGLKTIGHGPDVFVAKVTVEYGGRNVALADELQRAGNAGNRSERLMPERANAIFKHHCDDWIIFNNEDVASSFLGAHVGGPGSGASLEGINLSLHLRFLL